MRMRVLVVDPDPDARAALCSLLRTIGHEPLPVAQLRALAGPAQQPAAHAAVLAAEWTRPQHSADLRAFSQTDALPILLLTNVDEENVLADMADLPVFAVLLRPVAAAALAAALATAAARFAELQALRVRCAELDEALETRKLLDRAKGRLMQLGMSEEAAFRALQQRARDTRQPIKAVAQAILRS